ncbi:exopolysaccharide biosynthesis polyprenyl glycosylphosphotransferase [Microbacterium sp. SYP-A9085]|uniref:sugar transferase n=1 Tax=Microbacterium sp. SYP-A9085 TaxID=2664454 RepID=UPI00129AFE31|nr:sugar transferase [Microbacterium sp. SYP-A9085]MRH29151.1 exopolysaccharide biosynthesis polyprenyl glycosylphosphotransferase [Microbacterium sp. SYP-A9085]
MTSDDRPSLGDGGNRLTETSLTTDWEPQPTRHSEGRLSGEVCRDNKQASPDVAPRRGPTKWRKIYSRRVAATDLLVLIWVVYGTQIGWLGFGNPGLDGLDIVSYWAFSAFLVATWFCALSLADTRSDRVIGKENTEYVRVADTSLRVFGALAIAAFLMRVDIARGFLLLSLPIGIIVLLVERWLWRQWLVSKRALGQFSAHVLLVGSEGSVVQISRELNRAPDAGYRVVGACVPRGQVGDLVPGTEIAIMGDLDSIENAIAATDADTVAITSTGDLPPGRIKQISWGLAAGHQHLVLAPSVTDIAGPRIHARPVAGLPLIHVETPRFSAGQRFSKRTFDILFSTVLLIVLFPVLLLVAILVKTTSRGPLIFSHERVGLKGQSFRVLKFRSMKQGADRELAALLADQGTADSPLFKVRNDPRITQIGRILRKYSLDELPQLFNVIAGSMSLVGPRPQVAAEVALYSDAAKRRLLARPGITGLWQVSGRSSLAWDDAVRLDLYYVENWSLLSDIAILAKTLKAVVRPGNDAV